MRESHLLNYLHPQSEISHTDNSICIQLNLPLRVKCTLVLANDVAYAKSHKSPSPNTVSSTQWALTSLNK